MADQKRWWKLWCSTLTDDGILRLSLEDRWRWVALGAYIAEHGTKGAIEISPNNPMLLMVFGVQLDGLKEVLKRLPNVSFEEGKNRDGKIIVTFHNWHKYQVDSNGPLRMKMLRSKRRREEIREEEIRKEENTHNAPQPNQATNLSSISPPTESPAQPHQCLINRFLELKGTPRTTLTAVQLRGAYKRHSRSAQALIAEAGGLDYAMAALEWGAGFFDAKRLTWTLDTIAKHLPTFAMCGRDAELAARYGLSETQLAYAKQLAGWLQTDETDARQRTPAPPPGVPLRESQP